MSEENRQYQEEHLQLLREIRDDLKLLITVTALGAEREYSGSMGIYKQRQAFLEKLISSIQPE